MAVSGSDIRLEVGRTLNGLTSHEALREVTAGGTATGSITDAVRLASSAYTGTQWMGRIVRVNDKGSQSGAYGSLAIARDLAPATGVLNVSPVLQSTPVAADTVELWAAQAPHPDDIDRARDRALTERCTRWRLNPLTWLTDGDFVSSTVSSAWVGANATAAKQVAAGVERFVERYLQVTNSAANGYMGQTVNCNPGDSWTFYVAAQAANNTSVCQLQVYDLTNGALVPLSVTSFQLVTGGGTGTVSYSGRSWEDLAGNFVIPSGCKQISVRIGGAGSADITNWANFVLYPTGAHIFPLPRAVNTSYVGYIFELRNVTEWPMDEMVILKSQPQVFDVGGGFTRLQFNSPVENRILFWQEFAYYDALQTDYTTPAGRRAGDTALTNCPLDYIKWATLFDLQPQAFEQRWRWADQLYGAKKIVRRIVQDPQRATAFDGNIGGYFVGAAGVNT